MGPPFFLVQDLASAEEPGSRWKASDRKGSGQE
jgi:hypothetical protein